MGKILYKKLIRQYSDDGGLNWKNTDVWKVGEIIENPSNCEGEYVEGCYWKQLPISEEYLCDGVNKRYKLIELCNNNGIMKPSGRNKMGDVYETNSRDCGYVPPEPQYRWVESGTMCVGFDKYVKEIEEKSVDEGLTWNPTGKERQGALIEKNSVDCGYVPPTPGSDELAFEYDTTESPNLKYILNNVEYTATTSPYSTTLANLGIASLTNCKGTFHKTKLTKLIKFPNTQKVTNMKYMFSGCTSLPSIDVSNFNTQNVTNMNEMFYGCEKLTSLDVSSFNTSKVTDMGSMFRYCESLTSLDLSNFNTQNVTNMEKMFERCYKLTSLDVSSFNTQNVTSMGGMFDYCQDLTSLDLSSFNTQNVTSMGGMFSNCSSLSSLDVSHFNTQNVRGMGGMFDNCHKLTSLDLSSFNTQNVTNMGFMFWNCSSLQSLDLSNWDTQNVTTMDVMFTDCVKLTSVTMNNCSCETIQKIRTKLDTNLPGQSVTIYSNTGCPGTVPTPSSDELVFEYDNSASPNLKYKLNNTEYTATTSPYSTTLTELGITKLTSCDYAFDVTKLTKLIKFPNTQNVTNMSYMFNDCWNLTSLDLSNWDLTNVTDMGKMFYNCWYLSSLDLSNWNAQNVTNMWGMFYDCRSLTSLDLSSWNTKNAKYMNYMFYNCEKLTSLNASNWVTQNVTQMNSMFRSCSSLTTLDVSNWDLTNVTDMGYMFYFCKKLSTIYMRNCSQDTFDKIINQLSIDLPGQRVDIITK